MSQLELSSPEALTFQQALKRLEEVASILESDTVDLDAALKTYEEGLALARNLMERLNAAELRVKQLSIE